ncbi:MAG: ABC transporter ATP-binding protein [Alphaproteobacteria bacterium]|nr:ABC transporter ATP-binding protein [Alphaproteobacteria bacterium]
MSAVLGNETAVPTARAGADNLLTVTAVAKRFGGLTALDDVSFDLANNEVLGLIGPNGSGKTTLFNIISGLLRPDSGAITLRGRSIHSLAAHQIAATGIGRTFQNARLFAGLTILENICLPQYVRSKTHIFDALFCARHERAERQAVRARAEQLLGELAGGRLFGRRHDLPETCSLGEQRMIEVMRVLALDPELVLMDEPTQGLNPTWVVDMLGLVDEIRRRGRTILFIEHKMSVVMKISDRIVVLNSGRKICEGPPERVRNDPDVLRAYLGQ